MDYKFNVIIPTYNRSEKLKKAVKSVLNQTYTNWESFVADDCSMEEEYFQKEKFFNELNCEKVHYLYLHENKLLSLFK